MSSLNCAIINRYKIASTQTRRKMRWAGRLSAVLMRVLSAADTRSACRWWWWRWWRCSWWPTCRGCSACCTRSPASRTSSTATTEAASTTSPRSGATLIRIRAGNEGSRRFHNARRGLVRPSGKLIIVKGQALIEVFSWHCETLRKLIDCSKSNGCVVMPVCLDGC